MIEYSAHFVLESKWINTEMNSVCDERYCEICPRLIYGMAFVNNMVALGGKWRFINSGVCILFKDTLALWTAGTWDLIINLSLIQWLLYCLNHNHLLVSQEHIVFAATSHMLLAKDLQINSLLIPDIFKKMTKLFSVNINAIYSH